MHRAVYISMYSNMYIIWWVYFVTGLSYVLQQPPSAGLAKTTADIAKKSSHSFLSHCLIQFHASHYIQYYFRRFDRINSPIFVAINKESKRQPTENGTNLIYFTLGWDWNCWIGFAMLAEVGTNSNLHASERISPLLGWPKLFPHIMKTAEHNI